MTRSLMGRTMLPATLILMIALAPLTARAACVDPSWIHGDWLVNYGGTIDGKWRIRMTLAFAGDNVEGVYFYQSQLKDIRVKGHVTDGKMLVLEERDDSGRVTARFDTQFAEHDPKGRFSGDHLECEILVGSWSRDGKAPLPVYLAQDNVIAGTLQHQYDVAGVADDGVVDASARVFWKAVRKGDRETVARQIAYPVNVSMKGMMRTIRNADELVRNYDAIFTMKYRQAILDAAPLHMFARDQGVSMGDGLVWFRADGKIFALNNND